MRLSLAMLPSLPSAVVRPAYDVASVRIGIVHLGAGAFHRAHQALYVADLLAGNPDWGICAVSLHSQDVRDALRPQDGLYTLSLLEVQPRLRVIGALREVLCAPLEQPAVLARLAAQATRLVTLTITEKGYCLAGDGLDFTHPEIIHDVSSPDAPRSAIGYLVAALAMRRARGIPPFSVLSCDNLPANGAVLRRAVLQLAGRNDVELARWIESAVAFPCSMVDSITPATDASLRTRVETALGAHDAWPVQREPFSQWVVEDRFCNDRPPLEAAGVTFSDDIAGYARAKLRLLNGAHSTLAYLGLLMGVRTVAEAMQTPALARFVERLMRDTIAPAITLPSGLDAPRYVSTILERFSNPAVHHQLAQIAWDGSQKLPVRLLDTVRDGLQQGVDIAPLCLAIAGWLHFVRRQALAATALVDPLDESLRRIGTASTGSSVHDVAAFLRVDAVFGTLARDTRFIDALVAAYAALQDASPASIARALS